MAKVDLNTVEVKNGIMISDSMVVYASWIEGIKMFPEALQLKILMMLFNYGMKGIIPEVPAEDADFMDKMAYGFFVAQMPAIQNVNKARMNGNKGGRPKKYDLGKNPDNETVEKVILVENETGKTEEMPITMPEKKAEVKIEARQEAKQEVKREPERRLTEAPKAERKTEPQKRADGMKSSVNSSPAPVETHKMAETRGRGAGREMDDFYEVMEDPDFVPPESWTRTMEASHEKEVQDVIETMDPDLLRQARDAGHDDEFIYTWHDRPEILRMHPLDGPDGKRLCFDDDDLPF